MRRLVKAAASLRPVRYKLATSQAVPRRVSTPTSASGPCSPDRLPFSVARTARQEVPARRDASVGAARPRNIGRPRLSVNAVLRATTYTAAPTAPLVAASQVAGILPSGAQEPTRRSPLSPVPSPALVRPLVLRPLLMDGLKKGRHTVRPALLAMSVLPPCP